MKHSKLRGVRKHRPVFININVRNFTVLSERFQDMEVHRKAREKERMRYIGSLDLYEEPERSPLAEGDRILADVAKMRALINMYPIQEEIFDQLLNSALPNIYGMQTFNSHRNYILKKRQLRRHKPFVLILTPRRQGKTYIVAFFIFCMLTLLPNYNVAVFAVTLHRAKEMVRFVGQYFDQYGNPGDKLQDSTRLRLTVAPGDVRTMEAYSSRANVSESPFI